MGSEGEMRLQIKRIIEAKQWKGEGVETIRLSDQIGRGGRRERETEDVSTCPGVECLTDTDINMDGKTCMGLGAKKICVDNY